MISACVVAFGLILVSGGTGRGMLRIFRADVPRGEGVFSAIALGLGALSLVLFIVGLAGGFQPVFLWGLMVVLAVLFARDVLWTAERLVETARRFARDRRGVFEGVLVVAVTAALLVNFAASLAPPSETDALTIHLYAPREYAEAGEVFFMPDNWDVAMVMGPHMVYAALITLTGGQLAPAVFHFLVGGVWVLWVWRFTRRRFGKKAAYVAAAVLYNVPMISHLTIAPMVDMLFALYTLGALAWLLEFLRTARARDAIAACAFAGFSANAKYSGLTVLGAVCAAAGVEMLLRRRLRAAGAIAAAAVTGLLIASPFLVRNYAWTGNPVFPTMKNVFGGEGWDAPRWQQPGNDDPRREALKHSTANMLLAPWVVTTNAETASGGISELIGPVFIVFLPLVVFMRSRSRILWHMGLYMLAAFFLTYYLSPRPRSRYFLSIMPALAALSGLGTVFLAKYSRAALAAGRVVILAGIASGLGVTLLYSASFVKVAFGLTSRDAFLARSTDFYGQYRWMDENLGPDAKVLVQATNDLYYCPRPAMRLGFSSAYTMVDSQRYFGLDASGNPDTAAGRLAELGITHVFAGDRFVSTKSAAPSGRILAGMLEAGTLKEIHRAESTRGTRNPLSKPRVEGVVVYAVAALQGDTI